MLGDRDERRWKVKNEEEEEEEEMFSDRSSAHLKTFEFLLEDL